MSVHPQTPQSPSQFSSSVADHSSSMNTSMTSIASTLPTPAHSVNGHSTTDSHDITMGDDMITKRKRSYDDLGEQEQKKVQLEDTRKLCIQDLHQDVGEKYLFCRTPISTSSPDMSLDLFDMFGLSSIAAEVARTKPNGEKNALRKTYKGHIKTLGVNGHFDADKKEINDQNGFMSMLSLPEMEWHVHQVAGKEMERGFSEETRLALPRATTMAKGPLPSSWDSSVLGDLAPGNVSKKGSQTQPSKAPDSRTGKPTLGANRSQGNMKKRSFQDISFEGHRDNFQDDDAGGYSTGDGDERMKMKRMKMNAAH